MESSQSRYSGKRKASAESQVQRSERLAARSRVSGADGSREEGGSGIPPSNTIPDNCNGGFKALRWGVDSLYLSYRGELDEAVLIRLKALKRMAQGQDTYQQSLAQYPVAGHIFEIKDKGAPLFPYVLDDGAYRLQLSQGGTKVPMAYVKVSSALLAHLGPVSAEKRLRYCLQDLGKLKGEAQVSRIDLFVDFVWTGGGMEWPRDAWVTRATSIDTFSEHGRFTGWVVGKGGAMMARLYNKSFQATKLGIDYLAGLWREAGRQDGEEVWRLEFQIKRDVLAQMGIAALSAALRHLSGLWSYATTEWLRLAIPNGDDQTRSRWPVHPLWGYLSSVDWESAGGPVLRHFSASRAPKDEKLLSLYLSALVSFMAKRGITDLHQGQETLLAAAVEYYSGKACWDGLSFEHYFAERVALKARKFNTLLNEPEILERVDEADVAVRAEEYRKGSGGE